MIAPLKHGPWHLADLQHVPKNGMKVFSCFHCAGGSTMGYKLAGYDVLGGVEIDPKIMAIYRANHKPKHSYLMGVQDFNNLPDDSLPESLFNLDILDGSPPCSTFSMAGLREQAWGKLKMFREGQAVQVLDDLFGHFLFTVNKLRPKIVVAENVKGMILGKARGYTREIIQSFASLGYTVQVFLLNASSMGVPQRRERVFFIANRLGRRIDLRFGERNIPLHSAIRGITIDAPFRKLSALRQKNWQKTSVGKHFGSSRAETIPTFSRCDPKTPTYTLAAMETLTHWSQPRFLQGLEVNRVQTFPDDFNFCGQNATYVCGMSVPPYMMQRVALQVQAQLLEPKTAEKKE